MIADRIEAIGIAQFYFFDGFLACAHFFKEDAEPQFLRRVNRIARICKSYFQGPDAPQNNGIACGCEERWLCFYARHDRIINDLLAHSKQY